MKFYSCAMCWRPDIYSIRPRCHTYLLSTSYPVVNKNRGLGSGISLRYSLASAMAGDQRPTSHNSPRPPMLISAAVQWPPAASSLLSSNLASRCTRQFTSARAQLLKAASTNPMPSSVQCAVHGRKGSQPLAELIDLVVVVYAPPHGRLICYCALERTRCWD
jgi:hypothetical protein